jgi:hypothetical protein
MTKTVMYEYQGTNGIICSPIHLEDAYYIRKIQLVADEGKRLTKDDKHFFAKITVPEADAELWKEVKA